MEHEKMILGTPKHFPITFLSTIEMFHFFVACIVSEDKFDVIFIFLSIFFSSGFFQDFLSLIFCSLSMICLGIVVFFWVFFGYLSRSLSFLDLEFGVYH